MQRPEARSARATSDFRDDRTFPSRERISGKVRTARRRKEVTFPVGEQALEPVELANEVTQRHITQPRVGNDRHTAVAGHRRILRLVNTMS